MLCTVEMRPSSAQGCVFEIARAVLATDYIPVTRVFGVFNDDVFCLGVTSLINLVEPNA